MRKIGLLGVALAAFLFVAGCNQQAIKENEQLKGQVSTLTEENNTLKGQVESLQKEVEDLKTQVANVTSEKEAVQKELDALKAKAPKKGKK